MRISVGPPNPSMLCINRLHDKPFASDEKSRCHLPLARESEVHDNAKSSNMEVEGSTNALDAVLNVDSFVSTVSVGIHRGVTPGGNLGPLLSSFFGTLNTEK